VTAEAIHIVLRAGWDIGHVLTADVTRGEKVCFTSIAIAMAFVSAIIVYFIRIETLKSIRVYSPIFTYLTLLLPALITLYE
jgi:hypothetical protein